MKRSILIRIMQELRDAKVVLEKLLESLRDIPVKRILNKILPELTDLSARFERWITAILELVIKKVGKIPVFQ